MDKSPLLSVAPSFSGRLTSAAVCVAAASGGGSFQSLAALPEHEEVSIPPISVAVSPSSVLKDRLIFGPSVADPSEAVSLLINDSDRTLPPGSPPPMRCPTRSSLHRSRTAPVMPTIDEVSAAAEAAHRPRPPRPRVVRQAVILLVVYLSLGVVIYTLNRHHFSSASRTHPVVDALYFCIVTMCTIGYGDITPATTSAKLFSITFVLVGFGFVDILLSGMVSYVLDLQESLLLKARHHPDKRSYFIDVKKGRMRIRMKVGLALCVVVLCVGAGAFGLRFLERLTWVDCFYLSVMSVTTVGYGDQAFKSLGGRIFAAAWLLVSTLAVARAFLFLAEARIDRRHRMVAKWVLSRDMTVSEFLAADIDHNGFVAKSEFVVYKLKEMGKVAEKDILQICEQFDRLDTGNCGKITLSDLVKSHPSSP